MQNKLSSSLLMEIFVHLVALALTDIVGPIIILVQNAFGINGRAFTVIGVIYIMVVYMLFMWYPVAIGAIVRWSISGFLRIECRNRTFSSYGRIHTTKVFFRPTAYHIVVRLCTGLSLALKTYSLVFPRFKMGMTASAADKAVQTVQHVNTLVATIISLLVHGYIIRQILRKYSVLTQYQNLLVAQSSLYVVGTILRFCMNQTVTLDLELVIGYSFIPVAKWVEVAVEFSINLVEGAEGVVLVIFNVHRLLIFLRPHFIKPFYVVTIPTSLSFIIFDSYVDTFNPDLCPFLSDGFYVAICGITIACYILLRRHFRSRVYSDIVKRMQNKLSRSLLMQIFVHLSALALVDVVRPVIDLVLRPFNANKKTLIIINVVYFTFVNMVFIWYPVAIGIIIKWSISGFLRRSDSDSSVKEFTLVRRSTLEKSSHKALKY
ncbi:hypothetical protein Y032_0299g1793 [Ancylostoma ceylanicum]|nr:hypothetical protein Y032_0299g1793 [Ancylostoma ceylanicum]